MQTKVIKRTVDSDSNFTPVRPEDMENALHPQVAGYVPEIKPVLLSVAQLCRTLRTEKIDYCHWKSNAALDRSAMGENDLDLLVGHGDAQRFTEILCRLGFREAHLINDEQLPGVRDFYGYDPEASRLVHVHAHFQLILGHDLSKNYHLPLERPYLDSAAQGDVFRVPAPEFELAVFVIRMVLKHSTLDAILMGHGRLSDSERLELRFLLSETTLEKAAVELNHYMPSLDLRMLAACLQTLQPKCSFWRRIRTGQQLQNELTPCARRPQTADILLKLWRRLEQPILLRLHLRIPKHRMASGGLLVAIVGGDGSGKTTIVNGLFEKLSKEFDVIKVHMGKPSWSGMTILIRGILKIGRSIGLFPFVNEGTEPSLATNVPSFPGYPWLIREVCTARDRYLNYTRARRLASNGSLVICDRFPLPQIKIMDGPQVERLTSGIKTNPFIQWLATRERQYYERILEPDVLIALRVDPETCVQRKTDETADSVRSRAGEVWGIDWQGSGICIIDAGRSRSEVLSEVLSLVWSNL